MKYKTIKKLWLAAAILTTTTSLWTNVNAMETPAASGAGVIRALNEQRILSEQYALQQIQTGAGELAEGEAAGEAEINDEAELSLGNAEEEMPAADQPELAVAIAPNYVNIRKEPSTEGEVIGKLYRNTVGVIEAAEEGWYYITSGSVSGYVSAEYVCVGRSKSTCGRNWHTACPGNYNNFKSAYGSIHRGRRIRTGTGRRYTNGNRDTGWLVKG